MHIFIDESGVFMPSLTRPGISLVGALVIPDARMAYVERKYKVIRARLPKERGEVKGRSLSESEVASIVELLRRNECLLEVMAIDLNMHTEADISAHRLDLARVMTSGVTPAHHQNVHEWAQSLAKRVKALNNQLYVQSVLTVELVRYTTDHATNYYAQRRPHELAGFRWVIDGKDKACVTESEDLWTQIVRPLLMAKSVEQPMAMFEGGDYEHFKRFEGPVPDWLPKPEGAADTATDVGMLITEHFRYSSDNEPGLELADIVVTATRRALTGNLQIRGWKEVPSLMIHRPQQYIHLVKLHNRPVRPHASYERALRRFTRSGRNMLAPRFSRD
jgi:hypothetical protein